MRRALQDDEYAQARIRLPPEVGRLMNRKQSKRGLRYPLMLQAAPLTAIKGSI